MRVGLISDTHGLLRPEVFGAFAGVEAILHAGDVGDEDILVELEAIAPVTAVIGNTDGAGLAERLPEVARLTLAGATVVVAHGHRWPQATARAAAAAPPDAELVVFGHSHRSEVERVGRTLAVNPGAAGHRRFRSEPSVAIAEIAQGRIEVRIVELSAG
jgi:uncharacterized protein